MIDSIYDMTLKVLKICIFFSKSHIYATVLRPSILKVTIITDTPRRNVTWTLNLSLQDFIGPFYSPILGHVAYQNFFCISEPKHMLWVLKRPLSMRGFF